jgi:hypothetical protein
MSDHFGSMAVRLLGRDALTCRTVDDASDYTASCGPTPESGRPAKRLRARMMFSLTLALSTGCGGVRRVFLVGFWADSVRLP